MAERSGFGWSWNGGGTASGTRPGRSSRVLGARPNEIGDEGAAACHGRQRRRAANLLSERPVTAPHPDIRAIASVYR
ncbi:hypothetical protein Asi03nite_58780 [Actinoplanes siamensis]|uniref:Uncharacterized protein n=1 Tax=Actinoplanes siamensis TaxID=1223317 RepID=A0A919NCX6_9ACTN|nr:hypothetical protein Asi03nite_58780 [Actinoplanes siamensis]